MIKLQMKFIIITAVANVGVCITNAIANNLLAM